MSSSQFNYTFVVTEKKAHYRLDKFLISQGLDLSRSRVQTCIQQGYVLKKGIPITDSSYKVKQEEVFQLILPSLKEAIPSPQVLNLEILYEDEDLLVINKAPGMVVHPAPGHSTSTLVNGLLAHCKDSLSGIGGVKRPGIVHRLDKDTSGLMVVAKNDETHQSLSQQFQPKILSTDKERTLKRIYWGLCWGKPSARIGSIEGYIQRHPRHRQKMFLNQKKSGRFSRTFYDVKAIKSFNSGVLGTLSWIQYTLDTGRTHQIRLHSQFAGFPLIGDPLYGKKINMHHIKDLPSPVKEFKRQLLHAVELFFIHPRSGKEVGFKALPPEDFLEMINWISS